MRQWLGVFGLCLIVVLCVGCPTGGSVEGSKVADDWDVPVKSESAYRLTQRFLELNPDYDKNHTGEDVGGKLGDPVFACAYGRFYTVDYNSSFTWGNVVQIGHTLPTGDKVYTVYAHLDEIIPEVKEGVEVYEGDQIGTIGDANRNYPPHLHLELRDGETPWDPSDELGHGYVQNVYPSQVQHLRALYLFIKMRQEQIVPKKLNTGYQEIKTNVMTGGDLLSFEYKNQLANVYQAVENGWIDWPEVYHSDYNIWSDTVVFLPEYRYRVYVRKSGITMRLFQPDWGKAPVRDMALADFIAFGLIPETGIQEVFPSTLNTSANPPSNLFTKDLKSLPILDVPNSMINQVKLPFGIDYGYGLSNIAKTENQYQSVEVKVKFGEDDFGQVKLYRIVNPSTPLLRALVFAPDSGIGISGNFILPDNY